jgi:uncharacterized protein (DUF58 family)
MIGWATTGVAVSILGIVIGSPPVVFIGAAILLVRIVAEIWPQRVLAALDYQRQMVPERTVVGDAVEVRLSIWNRTRLPIPWAAADDATAGGLWIGEPGQPVEPASRRSVGQSGRTALRVAGPLRPYERFTRRLRIVPLRRGVHEIGPVTLKVAELFGTGTPRRDREQASALLIARPAMAAVIGRLPTEAPLAQRRARRSLFTDPTLFAGVRPFVAGDPLRSIHWRASARQGSLQAKRFEPSLSAQAMIVFDIQTLEGVYWELVFDEQLFEEIAIGALSVARTLVSGQTPCGFAAAGYTGSLQQIVFLPPRADRSQLGRIGDALARLGMESSAPLTRLLAWLPRRVARGTSLIVLTGRGPAPNASVVRRLRDSGFPVHFLLFGAAAQAVDAARRIGLSAWPARVDSLAGRPQAVVIGS